MDSLDKARAIRSLIAAFRKANPGTSEAAARKALGIPRAGTSEMKHYHPPSQRGHSKPQKVVFNMAKPRRSSETIVPDDSGDGVTTRGGSSLYAKIGGHVVVNFDGPALGAMWSGLIRQALYANTQTLPQLFPEQYPEQAAAQAQNRKWVQEREIGAELWKIAGAAFRAFAITPEIWAAMYSQAMASAPPAPFAPVINGTQPMLGDGQGGFGSPLGIPTQITGPFGEER